MTALRRLARRAVIATPLPEWRTRRRAAGAIAVLGYHRISEPLGRDYPFNDRIVSSTPQEFARELRYLRANFDVISMRELLAGLRDPRLLPPRPAVITFDDGYADNYTQAFPLLQEAGLPATFFVCTGLVGTRRLPWYEHWVCCFKQSRTRVISSPFDDDESMFEIDDANWDASFNRFRRRFGRLPWSKVARCLKRLEVATGVDPEAMVDEPLFMSHAQLREMAAAGMDIGGHTRMHPILNNVDDLDTLRSEVGGCFDDLARELDTRPISFAYPWGTAEAMSSVADAEIDRAGFQISFSFIHGLADRVRGHCLRLPRVHVSCLDDFQAFRLRMATAPAIG